MSLEERKLKLINLVQRTDGKIVLLTHENPDGDSLGSALAFYLFLKKLKKDVVVASKDPVPHSLDFLPASKEVLTLPLEEEFDLGIIFDSSGFNRVGAPVRVKKRVRIDHHLKGERCGEEDLIEPSAPSTTFLVYKLLKSWDERLIDEEIATCLYTGLATDTGFFRYSNTNGETFQVAKELVERGAKPYYVYSMFAERERLSRIKLLSLALSKLKLYFGGKVAGIILEEEDFKRCSATYEDSEGIVSYGRSLEGVEVSFILIERKEEGVWKVSLRSKNWLDVAKVCEKLGGGGHRYAAGAKIPLIPKEEALKKVLSAIGEELKEEVWKT